MTDRDLIAEGRAILKTHATSGVLVLGQWVRANLSALLDELEALRGSLAAIKAADPDLFDPVGTSRGAAYETYGSAGHDLREKYLAAVGLVPEDEEDDDDE